MARTPKPIVETLMDVRKAVGIVPKAFDATRDLEIRGRDDVINTVAPFLEKYRVLVVPDVLEQSQEVVQVREGSSQVAVSASVLVKYTFHGPAGDSISCMVAAGHQDYSGDAMAAAMTKAERTAFVQVLSLPTGPAPTTTAAVKVPRQGRTAGEDNQEAGGLGALLAEAVALGGELGITASVVRGEFQVAVTGDPDSKRDGAVRYLAGLQRKAAEKRKASAEKVKDARGLLVEASSAEDSDGIDKLLAKAKALDVMTVDVRAILGQEIVLAAGFTPSGALTLAMWLTYLDTTLRLLKAETDGGTKDAPTGGPA